MGVATEVDLSPGACGCGCGERTPLATRTRNGNIEGQPTRYVAGHSRRRGSLEARFWRNLPAGLPDEACWEWGGARRPDGYGVLGHPDGVSSAIRAHRMSYEFHHGPIPEGMVVRHKCDNPPCVNPGHLEVGTHGDNGADRDKRGRTRLGSNLPHSKLTEQDVRRVWQMRDDGGSQYAIAAELGVHRSTIAHIVQGKNWKHVEVCTLDCG